MSLGQRAKGAASRAYRLHGHARLFGCGFHIWIEKNNIGSPFNASNPRIYAQRSLKLKRSCYLHSLRTVGSESGNRGFASRHPSASQPSSAVISFSITSEYVNDPIQGEYSSVTVRGQSSSVGQPLETRQYSIGVATQYSDM
eukprot:85126-Pleurochrysis_carterae.AAC.5